MGRQGRLREGDGVAPLRVAPAALAGHKAEVGLELMRMGEALNVVDRGDEGGGRHRPDARHGAQALDARIVSGQVLDRLVSNRRAGG